MDVGTVPSFGSTPAAGPDASYAVQRDRVDAAHLRMQAIVSTPHLPAQARHAAEELTAALHAATATVTSELQTLAPTDTPPVRRRLRRRRTTRLVPAHVRPWLTELARLADIGVWLRRVTADDPGVLIPTAVRVGSRAATGPHVAGLIAEPQSLIAATLHEPRIGVDLQAIVDTVHQPTGVPASQAAAATTATLRAAA